MCYEMKCPHQDHMGNCTIPSWEYRRPGFEWPCISLGDGGECPVEGVEDTPQIVFIEIPYIKER